MEKLVSHSATIFPVNDPLESARYYSDKMGFKITFQWDNPPTYVVTKLGESVSIHFVKRDDNGHPSKAHVAMMIFTHDVDRLYEQFVSNGVEIKNQIGTRDYGMRDFDIIDPNGFILSFGQGVE